MRKRTVLTAGLAVALGSALVLASFAIADSGNRNFKANRIAGTFELPVVSTTGTGSFQGTLQGSGASQTINYTLRFQNLEGDVTQAHIHLGQRIASGGIMIWLCGTTSNPGPAGTPSCQSGTVTGTIEVGDVQSLPTQGIAATLTPLAAFEEAVAAMRAGNTYANVHSTISPGGEIRGQIGGGGGDDDDDDD